MGSCSLGVPWNTSAPCALSSTHSPFPYTCSGSVHHLWLKCMICPRLYLKPKRSLAGQLHSLYPAWGQSEPCLPPNLLFLQSPCDGGNLIVPHHLLGSLFLTHHSCVVGNLPPSQVSSQHLPVPTPSPPEAIASLLSPYSASSHPLVQSATHLGICQAWRKAALRATSTCTSRGRVYFPVFSSDSETSGGLRTTHFAGSHLHAFTDTPLPGMLFPFSKSSHLLCS